VSDTQKPPAGLRAPGRRLWDSIAGEYDLDEHELALLVEVVRTVDLCEVLEARVKKDGPLIDTPQGLKAHPAAVEARQQRIALARLLAALRMPAGDESDQVQGRRAQRRVGARGVYGIRGGKAS
jgi:hypothetical protein